MTFAEQRECIRRRLHQWGWVEWAEQHQRIDHLLIHHGRIFTQDHERGPLIIWEHPEAGCECVVPFGGAG